MKFRVIDNKTGKEADTYEIALHEEWASRLCYCDMEGFAITENGDLILADECGNSVYCDPERFKVVFEDERPHGEWIAQDEFKAYFMCTNCGYIADADYLRKWKFHTYDAEFPTACLKCGADMRKRGEAE